MTSEATPVQLAVALLWLPDGRLTLQRRTEDAPTAPGLLGLFGGHIEDNESPDQCIKRELAEETSLDISALDLKFVKEILLPETEDYENDRYFHIYEAKIETDDFAVYEGKGAESYYPNEILERNDASEVLKWAVKNVSKV